MSTINADLARRWNIQETYWSQRSRNQWLTLGDHNTSFFHRSTLQRRSINNISTLKLENGSWIDNRRDISAH
ncbi:hypothetical protein LINPERPRIM_LOCUS17654, partial [Linum perenne]